MSFEPKKIITSSALVELVEERFVVVTYTMDDGILELEDIIDTYGKAESLCEAKESILLVRSGKYILPSIEGKEVVILEFNKWAKVAIEVKNLGQKLMVNAIDNVADTHVKFFENKEEAINWLREG